MCIEILIPMKWKVLIEIKCHGKLLMMKYDMPWDGKLPWWNIIIINVARRQ